MNEQITKKEFCDAMKWIESSYICGDISKITFDKLVRIVSSVYYGQKITKLFEEFSNKIDERFDKILRRM